MDESGLVHKKNHLVFFAMVVEVYITSIRWEISSHLKFTFFCHRCCFFFWTVYLARHCWAYWRGEWLYPHAAPLPYSSPGSGGVVHLPSKREIHGWKVFSWLVVFSTSSFFFLVFSLGFMATTSFYVAMDVMGKTLVVGMVAWVIGIQWGRWRGG